MRIYDYLQQLQDAGKARLPNTGNAETVWLLAPDPDDEEAGPDMLLDSDAAEAVELHRALTAWLHMHRTFHPDWHKNSRRMNPGGPWGTENQRVKQSASQRRRAQR